MLTTILISINRHGFTGLYYPGKLKKSDMTDFLSNIFDKCSVDTHLKFRKHFIDTEHKIHIEIDEKIDVDVDDKLIPACDTLGEIEDAIHKAYKIASMNKGGEYLLLPHGTLLCYLEDEGIPEFVVADDSLLDEM
ncbi:MAG: hypothetical protein NC340_06125 [Ruminococcus flavefaciens]|nr:hypothetical protein [Ruminococcus flavefaciens]MCM1231248.1 hypothetical protein [Ruminococcus flavefaciens]